MTRHASSHGAPRGPQAPRHSSSPWHGCVLWLPSGLRWNSRLKRRPFSALTKRHRHVTFHVHPRPFTTPHLRAAEGHNVLEIAVLLPHQVAAGNLRFKLRRSSECFISNTLTGISTLLMKLRNTGPVCHYKLSRDPIRHSLDKKPVRSPVA